MSKKNNEIKNIESNKVEKPTIDLRILLVEALATTNNIKVEKKINLIYEKNKLKAYQIAKESTLYNHQMLTDGSIHREILSKRVLGLILLSEKSEEISQEIDKIIKLGWSKIYTYFLKLKKLKKELDFENIQKFMAKDESKLMKSAEEINSMIAISYFLAINLEIEIKKTEFLEIVESSIYNRLQFYEEYCPHRYSYKTTEPETKEKAKKLLQRIELKYGEIYFETIDGLLSLCEKRNKEHEELRIETSRISFLFDDSKCMASNMFENKISKEMKLQILNIYVLTSKNSNSIKAAEFLINAIIQKKLIDSYREVKKYFFANNKETLFLDLEKKDQKIEEQAAENKFLTAQNQELKIENSKLKKEYKMGIEQENTKLKKALKETKKTQKTIEELNREISELKSALYTEESAPKKLDQEPLNEKNAKVLKINSKKGIIIGGHQNWHNQLKEYITYDCVLEANQHLLNHIEEYDVVLFKTSYLNHPTYLKVIEKVRRKTPIFGYIKHNNVKLCIEEIEKLIKN